MSIVGTNIRTARRARGMTQQALADAVGTSKQNIYKYETGTITNIPLNSVEAIAAVLQVDPAVLLGWAPEPTMMSATGTPPSGITGEEWLLIQAYRDALPEYQAVVMDILSNHKRRTDP